MTPKIKPRALAAQTDEKPGLMSSSNMAMWGCCIAMVGGGAFLYFSGGASALGGSGSLSIALPLLACVGMHFVMHRMMGRSCHGTKEEQGDQAPEKQIAPVVREDSKQ